MSNNSKYFEIPGIGSNLACSLPSQLSSSVTHEPSTRAVTHASTMASQDFSLIVVSNRLPFVIKVEEDGTAARSPTAGGLATAVGPVLLESKGIWVGYPGIPGGFEGEIPDGKTKEELPSKQVMPVNVTKEEMDDFYETISNGFLWPVFHSMPEKAKFDGTRQAWKTYVSVNQKFADKTLEALDQIRKDGKRAVVWIQDYHLLLAGEMLREKLGDSVVMAFFLHIPFPQFEVFAMLPQGKSILEGLLACDIIGFHLESDCTNFKECCKRTLGYGPDDLSKFEGRLVKCQAMPIGIPFDSFARMAQSAQDINKEGMKIVLGADRLDYTKGIPQKIKAFERFLEKYPEFKEKVQLVQAAVPSRANMDQYQDLKDEVAALVEKVNKGFGNPLWTPIIYRNELVPQQELAKWYRSADVALILSLHDGMNLVAKEFVACQLSKPGVLVLSKFAGAAQTMEEALIVNPHDTEEVADTLNRALKMEEAEKAVRMHSMRAEVEREDVRKWMESFLSAVKDHIRNAEKVWKSGKFYQMFETYLSKRTAEDMTSFAILLDFDGTLAPLVSHPMLSEIPNDTKEILKKLKETPGVQIAMISGRPVPELMDKVGIPGICYSGSHGNVIRFAEGHVHENHVDPALQVIKNKLENELLKNEPFTDVWVEDKGYTLTIHFNQVERSDIDLERQTILFLDTAARAMDGEQFTMMPGHKSVEVKGQGTKNKGFAVTKILKEWQFWGSLTENYGAMYIGDDTTDEDAFRALKKNGVTIRVGRSSINTEADYHLPDVLHVKRLLKWILANHDEIMVDRPDEMAARRRNHRCNLF